MRVAERKVITLEMEAHEYGMLVDLLAMAKRVRSKKYPLMNTMAESLQVALEGEPARRLEHAKSE